MVGFPGTRFFSQTFHVSFSDAMLISYSMEELLNRNILDDLVKYSYANIPVGVIRETVKLFSELVNSPLQARFLTQGNVHGPLNRLLRSLDWDRRPAYADEIMDFLYGICEKIREYPELLYIFFEPEPTARSGTDSVPGISRSTSLQNVNTAANYTNSAMAGFPLLGLLLRYVQEATRLGDIARTAIGKLLELAEPGSDLEAFTTKEAELPQLFVASIGAMWSYCFTTSSPSDKRPEGERVSTGSIKNAEIKAIPPRRSGEGGSSSRTSPAKFGAAAPGTNSASEGADEDPLFYFINLIQFVQSIMTKAPSGRLAEMIASEFDTHFLRAILHESVIATQSENDSATASVKVLTAIMRMVTTVEEASVGLATAVNRQQSAIGLMDPIVRFLLGPDKGDKDTASVRSVLVSMISDERDEVAIPALRLVDLLCAGSRSQAAVEFLIEALPGWAFYGTGNMGPENAALLRKMRTEALPEVARWLALLPEEDEHEKSPPGTPTRRRSLSPTPGAAFIDPTQMIPYPLEQPDTSSRSETKAVEEDESRTLSTYVEQTEVRMKWASRPASPDTLVRVEGESPVDGAGNTVVDQEALKAALAALPALGKDTVVSLLLSLLVGFFKRSFDYNLALTGLMHRLATSPYPVLYAFFVAGDHLNKTGDEAETDAAASEKPAFLYPLLADLVNLAEERKMTVISSKELLAEARQAIAYPPVGVPNPALMKKLGYEENERKKAQWKNIVVLEEVCKEWVALVEVGATSL